VARKSVDFINRAESSDEQPFFMYVAPTAPHMPIQAARRHERLAQQWEGKLPQPPNYDEQDLSDKSSWLRMTGELRSRFLVWNETDFPHRMGSLYAVDDLVAQIVNALATSGELENTYIFFVSDNGYNLGAHRLIHKMAPYEESLRVPLVVAGPGIRQGTEERMALNIDLAPTFLELAGAPIPDDMDGRTLGPLLRQEPTTWRSDFFAQYLSGGSANGVGAETPPSHAYLVAATEIPSWRAVRNEQYILIEWNEDTDTMTRREYELYDLRLDPYQLRNVLATPAGQLQYAMLFQQLKNRMEELARCQGRSCRG
jgi:arylsulfatase A-like enzyme